MKLGEAKFKTATVLREVGVEVVCGELSVWGFDVSFVAKLKLPTVVEATKRMRSTTSATETVEF